MKRELRFFAAAPALAIILATSGCESDVKPVGDVLASDSTLALEVLGAMPDSIQPYGDTDTIVQVDSISIPTAASVDPIAEPVASGTAATRSDVVVASNPVRRTTAARRSSTGTRRPVSHSMSAPSRRASSASSSNRVSRQATRPSSSSTRTIASTSSTPGRAWLVLPVGSELEFEVDQQVCSANGSDFNATLSESVVRANGTLIPDGAAARGTIVSLASANSTAMPEIRIESLTFDGNTYAVSTRVTRADSKKVRTKSGSAATKVVAGAGVGAAAGGVIGRDAKSAVIGAAGGAIAGAIAGRSGGTYARCIPDGGHVIAELTEPLRIPLGD